MKEKVVVDGLLSRADLDAKVRSGEIDTVILGVTDIYGRLCGKRLDARFFLRSPFTSACNYLFACDMVRREQQG